MCRNGAQLVVPSRDRKILKQLEASMVDHLSAIKEEAKEHGAIFKLTGFIQMPNGKGVEIGMYGGHGDKAAPPSVKARGRKTRIKRKR
jgi:hypothetical protein